jgi:threonyl-tRNA synthetase
LALRVDGKTIDLADVVDHDAKIGVVTSRDPEARTLLRHDAAHVLAQAVQELYPGTQITFGPTTDDGFYYDSCVTSRSRPTISPGSNSA